MSSVAAPPQVPAKPASADPLLVTAPVAQAAAPAAAPSQLRGEGDHAPKSASQNRLMAGLEVIGGGLEIAGGVAFSLATGGLGAVVGGAAVLDGSMRVTHAIKDIINDERTDATISTAAQLAGASRETANRIDAGAGLAAGLATGGFGVKVALQAGGKLATKAVGAGLAANSLNGTYRGAEYVATGEQKPTWVNQAASAMGATSPVANGYVSLALSASLMGGAAAARSAARRSTTPPTAENGKAVPAAETLAAESAGAPAAKGTVPNALPATGPVGASPAVRMAAGSRLDDLPERPPSLREKLIENSGEMRVSNDPYGQRTFDTSIKRHLAWFNTMGKNEPLKKKAIAVEQSIEIGKGIPPGYNATDIAPTLLADMTQARRALAVAIAQNPVAFKTWQSFMAGRGAPKDAAGQPVAPKIIFYPVSIKKAAATYTPSTHTINMFVPKTEYPWHLKTTTAQMSIFTHEGHHAVIGTLGPNKGKPAGTLPGEYDAERRSHLALAYTAHVAQHGFKVPPAKRLSIVERDMIGAEIRYKMAMELAFEQTDGWAALPKPPMGMHRVTPQLAAMTEAARSKLNGAGQYTLYDGKNISERLYERMNRVDRSVGSGQLKLSPTWAKWEKLTQDIRAVADQASGAFAAVEQKSVLHWVKPSPVQQETIVRLTRELDEMIPQIEAMKTQPTFMTLNWD